MQTFFTTAGIAFLNLKYFNTSQIMKSIVVLFIFEHATNEYIEMFNWNECTRCDWHFNRRHSVAFFRNGENGMDVCNIREPNRTGRSHIWRLSIFSVLGKSFFVLKIWCESFWYFYFLFHSDNRFSKNTISYILLTNSTSLKSNLLFASIKKIVFLFRKRIYAIYFTKLSPVLRE